MGENDTWNVGVYKRDTWHLREVFIRKRDVIDQNCQN